MSRKPSELLHRVAEVSRGPAGLKRQAKMLHIGPPRLLQLRRLAKLAGLHVSPFPKTRHRYVAPSARFDQLDKEMDGPGCPRCFLHGTHTCTNDKDALARMAVSRTSEPVMPPPCDYDFTMSITQVSNRLRVRRETLSKALRVEGLDLKRLDHSQIDALVAKHFKRRRVVAA